MRLEDLQAQRTPCGMLLVLAGLREILALAGMNYYTSIVSLLVPVNKGFHIVRVEETFLDGSLAVTYAVDASLLDSG